MLYVSLFSRIMYFICHYVVVYLAICVVVAVYSQLYLRHCVAAVSRLCVIM